MKTANPASVMGTFVAAILSLILPASALAADATVRAHRDPAPVEKPLSERATTTDAFHDDPVLKYTWGPGDPDLAVPKFHFEISGTPKRRPHSVPREEAR
jgi:hypothetical protein